MGPHWPMAASGNLGSPPTFKAIEVLPQESPGHIGSTRASLQSAWTNWKWRKKCEIFSNLRCPVAVGRAHPPIFSAELFHDSFGNGSVMVQLLSIYTNLPKVLAPFVRWNPNSAPASPRNMRWSEEGFGRLHDDPPPWLSCRNVGACPRHFHPKSIQNVTHLPSPWGKIHL